MVPFYIKFIKRILKALTSKKTFDWSDSSKLALRHWNIPNVSKQLLNKRVLLFLRELGAVFVKASKNRKRIYVEQTSTNKTFRPLNSAKVTLLTRQESRRQWYGKKAEIHTHKKSLCNPVLTKHSFFPFSQLERGKRCISYPVFCSDTL